MAFEKLSAFLGERDCRRVTVEADGLDEASLAQAPQLAVARVERLVEGVAQVVGPDDAEGADRGQRAALGAAEHVGAVAYTDVLTFTPVRQTDVVRERLAGLQTLPSANVSTSAASTSA